MPTLDFYNLRLIEATAKVAVDIADATERATEIAKEKIQDSTERTKKSAKVLSDTLRNLSDIWGSRKD